MERFAAIDFETANGKRSSICSIGIAILEDDWVVDSIYTLVRPTPNFYTRWTTAIHGLSAEDTNDALCFEEAWESIAPKLKDLPLSLIHILRMQNGCLVLSDDRSSNFDEMNTGGDLSLIHIFTVWRRKNWILVT